MKLNLAVATVLATFPIGTADTPWEFHVTGTKADGTAYGGGVESASTSASIDLEPGTYTLTVVKNGVSSLASDPFVVTVPTTVELSVPDAAAKATIAAA